MPCIAVMSATGDDELERERNELLMRIDNMEWDGYHHFSKSWEKLIHESIEYLRMECAIAEKSRDAIIKERRAKDFDRGVIYYFAGSQLQLDG